MSSKLSEKARAFLEERRFAVLATINQDGTPQQSAMWYLLEGDTIVMNTRVGRVKERNIRRNPHISICVEDNNYVTISGKVDFVEDQQIAQADIYRLAVRYDGEELAQKQMEELFSKQQRVTLHLNAERVIDNLDE